MAKRAELPNMMHYTVELSDSATSLNLQDLLSNQVGYAVQFHHRSSMCGLLGYNSCVAFKHQAKTMSKIIKKTCIVAY